MKDRATTLRRQLGPFDATMIVMGGIVGSGIFINPYVVALHVHTPLSDSGRVGAGRSAGDARRVHLGRTGDAAAGRRADSTSTCARLIIPSVAFLYGWVLLLVTQTGGMAAVAVTFAKYYREITGCRRATALSRRRRCSG